MIDGRQHLLGEQPQLLRDILVIVLARLGVGSVQLPESGEADLT